METNEEKILEKALDGKCMDSEEIKEFTNNSKTSSMKLTKPIFSKNPKEFKSGEEMWQYAKKRNPKI
jgi:hypothetical protein